MCPHSAKMYRLLLLLVLPAFAKAYYTMEVYADLLEDKRFFQWTFPWLIDNLSGDVAVTYHLQGSGRYSVPQMCALEQLNGNVFVQADYLKCEADGLPAATCLCRTGIDAEAYRHCVHHDGHRAAHASASYKQLNLKKLPVIDTFRTGPIYDRYGEDLLKAVCSMYLEEDKPIGCMTLTGNGNATMASFDRNIPAHFKC